MLLAVILLKLEVDLPSTTEFGADEEWGGEGRAIKSICVYVAADPIIRQGVKEEGTLCDRICHHRFP